MTSQLCSSRYCNKSAMPRLTRSCVACIRSVSLSKNTLAASSYASTSAWTIEDGIKNLSIKASEKLREKPEEQASRTVSRLQSFSRSSTSSFLMSSSPFIHRPLLPISIITSSIQQQIRTKTYGNEYQPSQRVRKRRHGFLARRRCKSGRRVLARRLLKGRLFLSH